MSHRTGPDRAGTAQVAAVPTAVPTAVPAGVRDRLGDLADDETTAAWLADLVAVAPVPELALPDEATARDRLARMQVPDQDVDELLASRPDPERDADLWWLLARQVARLGRDMGTSGPYRMGPALPAGFGPAAPWFHVWVFLGTLPAVLAFHAARGVPEESSWATFSDLGEKIWLHRRKFGTGGIGVQFWFGLHLRGVLHDLGRLQFNLKLAPPDAGAGLAPGTPVLDTHIPERGGPMSPAACDASFARAVPFFERHFPDHFGDRPERVAVCTSWLLDPQLATYLPETSNIVAFLRRWTPFGEPRPGNASVLEFVFRAPLTPRAELPRRTRLERAVLEHLDAGREWYVQSGWLALPRP